MSETDENNYDERVRKGRSFTKYLAIVTIAVGAICTLILKYNTFPLNLLPESDKWFVPLYGIFLVLGFAIMLVQVGFHYTEKLFKNREMDKSKLEIVYSILLFASIAIYAGVIAEDISFPIISRVSDKIQILMRVGLFTVIFAGISALFLFGTWVGVYAIVDYDLIPLERRFEKEKENEERVKSDFRTGKPAVSISVPNQPIEFVGNWSTGYCDDQVIEVLFTATGNPPPKIEDYDWSISSQGNVDNTRLRICDGEIKILLCPPYYFLEPPYEKPQWWWDAESSYPRDGIEPGLTILTLTGMHRDYGGPGIATEIAVVDYDAPDWLKENYIIWMR